MPAEPDTSSGTSRSKDRGLPRGRDGYRHRQAVVRGRHHSNAAGGSPITVACVLGSNGLVGSALCGALRCQGTAMFSPAELFRCRNEPDLAPQIGAAVQAFAARFGVAEQ